MKNVFVLFVLLSLSYSCYAQKSHSPINHCRILEKVLRDKATRRYLRINSDTGEYNVLLGSNFDKCKCTESNLRGAVFYYSQDSFNRKCLKYTDSPYDSVKYLRYFTIGSYFENQIYHVTAEGVLPVSIGLNFLFKHTKNGWVNYKIEQYEN